MVEEESAVKTLYLMIPIVCLFASIVVGLAGKHVGRIGAHTITILAVALSFVLSIIVAIDVAGGHKFDGAVYTWAVSGGIRFEVGFLIDELSAVK